jgi:hypothetical protein
VPLQCNSNAGDFAAAPLKFEKEKLREPQGRVRRARQRMRVVCPPACPLRLRRCSLFHVSALLRVVCVRARRGAIEIPAPSHVW